MTEREKREREEQLASEIEARVLPRIRAELKTLVERAVMNTTGEVERERIVAEVETRVLRRMMEFRSHLGREISHRARRTMRWSLGILLAGWVVVGALAAQNFQMRSEIAELRAEAASLHQRFEAAGQEGDGSAGPESRKSGSTGGGF